MNPIFIAITIVSAIGLLSGLGLAITSKIMAVPMLEEAESILDILPGANCGACGFPGCAGYADALSSGKTKKTTLCAPGGTDVSKLIAEVTGLASGEVFPSAAVVLCQGNTHNAGKKLDYNGVQGCKMASQLFGGPKECIYGCIGYGDCVEACDYGAIHICNGIARINPILCRACRKCVNICPKNLIEMIPLHEAKAAVLCANKEKGAEARKHCITGCIGCLKCVKTCDSGAITVTDLCAKVDHKKCTACGRCREVCPVNAIEIIDLAGIVNKK